MKYFDKNSDLSTTSLRQNTEYKKHKVQVSQVVGDSISLPFPFHHINKTASWILFDIFC